MELCSLDIRELSWAWQHSWDSEDEDSEAEAGGDNTGDSAEAGEDTVQPATEEEVLVESLRPASAEEAAAGHTEDSSAPASAGAQEVNTASGGSDEDEEVKIEVTLEVNVEVNVEETTEVPVEVPARLLCAEILLDLVEDTFYICPPLPGHGGQELEARSQELCGQEVCEVILQEAVTSAVALVEVRSKGVNHISL